MHGVGVADASADVRLLGRLSPQPVFSPVPADGPRSLSYTLLDTVGHHDRILIKLALYQRLFTNMGGEVQLVTCFRPVVASKIDWVKFEVGRYVFHVAFQAEQGLRGAVATVSAGYRDIGVGDLTVEALVGSVV